MRTSILCLFCVALAAQNAAVNPPGLCSLEGKVVNDATGAPIADAKLKLQPPASPGAAQAPRVSFVTMTDKMGSFAFAGIEPGAYIFSAERAGYRKASTARGAPARPARLSTWRPGKPGPESFSG